VEVWEKDGHDALVVPEADEVWKIDIETTNDMLQGKTTVQEGMRLKANRMNEVFSRRPAEWRL